MDLTAKPYDLGQPYFPGMPHYPTHPPFLYSLTKKHGDMVHTLGATSAADAIALGTHVGTHIDALSHFSCNGVCYGARKVEQTFEHGMAELGVDSIAPIVRRGVLLDIAGLAGVDVLPADFEITPDHLNRASTVEIEEGDIVLLRTGWARLFSDSRQYINSTVGPGPGIEGARWLSSRKIFAAGADTVAFEKSPDPAMPVHVHLLVVSGIHIIEVLNLEQLARDRIYEFTFIAAPMNIRGATGAPLRPLAFPNSGRTRPSPLSTHKNVPKPGTACRTTSPRAVTASAPSSSPTMASTLRYAHGRFAQYWNTARQATGHMWQSRHYSCLMGSLARHSRRHPPRHLNRPPTRLHHLCRKPRAAPRAPPFGETQWPA